MVLLYAQYSWAVLLLAFGTPDEQGPGTVTVGVRIFVSRVHTRAKCVRFEVLSRSYGEFCCLRYSTN
jgi:hypothetical protein